MIADVWGWMLGLLAFPLAVRSLFWLGQLCLMKARGDVDGVARMLARRSASLEWENRLQTSAVAIVGVLLALGHGVPAAALLTLWMAWRWLRFARDERATLTGLGFMMVVALLAATGRGPL